jgi:hypothetical protein
VVKGLYRAYGRNDARQTKYQRPVANEKELRLALDAALRDGTGAVITLGSAIPLAAKVTIPTSGLVIQGSAATPIIPTAEMDCIFQVKSGTILDGIRVSRAPALQPGRAGNFVQDGGDDTSGVQVNGCVVDSSCARAVRCTASNALRWNIIGCQFDGVSAAIKNIYADVANEWSVYSSTIAHGIKFAGGEYNRVMMNNMLASSVDLTGSDLNVVMGNVRLLSVIVSTAGNLYDWDSTLKPTVEFNI